MGKIDYNALVQAFTPKRLALGWLMCLMMGLTCPGLLVVYMYKLQGDDARRGRIFDFANIESNEIAVVINTNESKEEKRQAGIYAVIIFADEILTLYLFYCLSLWRKLPRLQRYGIPALIGVVAFIVLDLYYFPLRVWTDFVVYIGLYICAMLSFILQFLFIDFVLGMFVRK